MKLLGFSMQMLRNTFVLFCMLFVDYCSVLIAVVWL